jgi:hypothetical protein
VFAEPLGSDVGSISRSAQPHKPSTFKKPSLLIQRRAIITTKTRRLPDRGGPARCCHPLQDRLRSRRRLLCMFAIAGRARNSLSTYRSTLHDIARRPPRTFVAEMNELADRRPDSIYHTRDVAMRAEAHAAYVTALSEHGRNGRCSRFNTLPDCMPFSVSTDKVVDAKSEDKAFAKWE